jgi:hypothetical protein
MALALRASFAVRTRSCACSDAYQRNELGRAAGETLLILVFFGSFCQKIQGENQLQKSEAFAFGDFISFDKRQKKRKQRKTLPRTGLTKRFIDAGIFLRGILPRRKTPHVLCGALRVCWHW